MSAGTHSTFTGIPVEILFLSIGALISVIYWDLKRGVSDLAKKAGKRDILLARICEKLGITWKGDD